MSNELIRASASDGSISISAEEAGWARVSFEVAALAGGETIHGTTGEEEVGLVLLSGAASVETEGNRWTLGPRRDVFSSAASAVYVPRDSEYVLAADGSAEVAISGARCERRLEPYLITPDDYSVELRGAGTASRQVVTLIGPDAPADRLLLVEVWTPGGNWSSYPPHKHEEVSPPDETKLEETYYFRIRKPSGFAVQRLYSPQRGVSHTWTIRDRELMLVPWGYHTTAAVPGYDLYYLNVLAGEEHALTAREDPAHAWVRDGWAQEPVDPRLPLFEAR